jgi:plasmid stabilization system protein ParE
MAKVIWTTPALNDLREIIEFIAQDSSVYAERVGMRIVSAPRFLETFPHSGRIVPEFSDESIRELIYGSYRIVYKIYKSDCFITAIIHASRDFIKHVQPGEWDVPS